jgi:transglutaminase-like putative cysteine protease
MDVSTDLDIYLQPSTCINSDSMVIQALSRALVEPGQPALDSAVKLYYWVRDHIRYNPYSVEKSQCALLASRTVEAGEGWCVPKAVLLAALCRATGIPARVGFADVRNHLSTERLRAAMGTDVFYFHGYCSIFIDGRWVKATPAFNLSLCQKFGLIPLEFNGRDDSLYHAFDSAGNRHMEYLRDRGEFLDVPFDELISTYRRHYPAMFEAKDEALPPKSSWLSDVERETGR